MQKIQPFYTIQNFINKMQIAKPLKIADVTYKEVMRMWNISEKAAQRRLIQVRNDLNKKRWHKLSVVQFCKVEDITVEEFYNRMQ